MLFKSSLFHVEIVAEFKEELVKRCLRLVVIVNSNSNNNYSRKKRKSRKCFSKGCINFVLILFKCFTVVENVTTTMIIPDLKCPTSDKYLRGPQEIPGACILQERSLSLPQPLPLEASEKTSTRWLDGEGRGNTD